MRVSTLRAIRRLSQIQLAGGTRSYGIQFSLNLDPQYVPGYNTWRYKSVVTHPDGYVRRYYANHVGQEILNVKEHPTDNNVYWATYTKYWTESDSLPKASYVRQIVPPKGIISRPVENANPASDPPFLTISLADGATDHAAFRLFDYFADGDAKDSYLRFERVKDGSGGTEITIREYDFQIFTGVLAGDGTLVFPSSMKEFPDPLSSAEDITTTYAHVLFGSTGAWLPQVKTRTTTLPVVPSSQNGDETTYTRVEEYDIQGRLIDSTDEKNIHTTYTYDDVTGARIRMTEAAGVLNFITDYAVDDLGRTVQTLEPVRSAANGVNNQSVRAASWTVYKDAAHDVWSAQGYATGTDAGPVYNFTLVNPVSIRKMDHAGRTIDEIAAVRADTEGPLSAGDSFPQSSWVRWTRHFYDTPGRESATRVYHAIPESGSGDPGVNYDETTFAYDIMDRRNRVRSPGGTITRTVFDPRDLPLSVWVGTNDTGATDSDPDGPTPPSPTIADPNNMRAVTVNEYDDGLAHGDGLLTKITRPVDDTTANDRVTTFVFDWRDRQIERHAMIRTSMADPRAIVTVQAYDNLDRVTTTWQYDTEVGLDLPTPNELTNLLAKTETFTDKRGRVYRTKRWRIDFPSGFPTLATAAWSSSSFTAGALTVAIEDNTWFDGRSLPVKQKPAGSQGYTKTSYDALGRATFNCLCYSPSDNDDPWQIQPTVSDKVFAQSSTTFDEASSVIVTFSLRRNSDTAGLVELTGANARLEYTAAWHDGANRQIAAANYGTNGGLTFSRPWTPPESGPGVLVTKTGYNERGEAFESTDPSGTVTRLAWDNAGRSVETIQNYQENGSGTDVNVTTRTTYMPDGGVATLTAVNPVTGDQTTHFLYGTTLDDSLVARSDLAGRRGLPRRRRWGRPCAVRVQPPGRPDVDGRPERHRASIHARPARPRHRRRRA